MRVFTVGVGSFLLTLFVSMTANAQFRGPSGQSGVTTVAAAQDARLGSYVTLKGNIVSHLRGEYYKFRDATGEIRVEVSRGIWRGREVTPTTSVRIMGEVDRGWSGRYIDVERLEILK